jgi:hypothetical protein
MNKYKIAIATLLIILAGLGIAGFALCAKLSAANSEPKIIAYPDPAKPASDSPVAFNPVQTADDIRVTLVSFSRQTIFEKTADGGTAVPYLSLLYVVEDLKNEKIKTWNVGSREIICDGMHAGQDKTLDSTFSMNQIPIGPWTIKVEDQNEQSCRASGFARTVWETAQAPSF